MDINLGRATLTVNPTTQADLWSALEKNEPFPERNITIGDLSASYASGDIPIGLGGGANVSLTADFSVGGHSGLSVFSNAADAIASLGLNPTVVPEISPDPDSRFLLLSFSATAQGSVSGTAPIGVVGSLTFGAKGAGGTLFAVLHRFKKSDGASTVISNAGAGIKLPREVKQADDLPEGTWVIAEVDGSLALSFGAKVGYDYSYTRDLPDELIKLGLSKDVSVKVDAAAEATVAYNVSGRYLVMVGRPATAADPESVLTLQVNKGSSYGYNFGLNLSAGVQMSKVLPDKGEDLVAASFGLFGPQIFDDVSKSIAVLESWSSGNLGANAASLTIDTAKKLLTAVTGVNTDSVIAEATGKLKDALNKWNALAQSGSSELQTLAWKLLGDPTDKTLITTILTDLRDQSSFDKALSDGLQSLSGQSWLMAIANTIGASSVLTLGTHQADVQRLAGDALDVLSDDGGGVIAKLQKYVLDRFHLTDVIATATDPTKLDQWVRDRLAAALNDTVFTSADLKSVQATVKLLLSKFDDLYAKTAAALTKKYNFEFAATYEKVTENATLLDLRFDLSQLKSDFYLRLLGGDTSSIFRLQGPVAGLTIRNAVMSHGIHRTGTTSLTLPYFSSKTIASNSSMAKLTFEQNGASLVGYLDAVDQIQNGRYGSMLRLAMKVGVKTASLTSIDHSLAYEMRTVAKNASKGMVTQATIPFVETYLSSKLPLNQYSDKLLADFDHAVDLPSSELGDMLMSMQVAIDGDFLSAWMVPADRLDNTKLVASRIVQRCMRDYTHRLYFRNANHLGESVAVGPLVWQSFPLCTGVEWEPTTETLGSTNTGKDVYFDHVDDSLIKRLIGRSLSSGALVHTVAIACQELMDATGKSGAYVFLPADTAATQMRDFAIGNSLPFGKVRDLVWAEAGVVHGIAKALESISASAASISESDPSQLLAHLADFGSAVTSALNSNLTNLFGKDDLRLFGPMLFVELTNGLSTGGSGMQTKAMLELKSLVSKHTFDITTYVGGADPSPGQVAVAQTIVSV